MPEPIEKYPLTGFHFTVAFELFPQFPNDFKFQEVSGLKATVTMKNVREGGKLLGEHKLPTGITYDDITLKRGTFVLPSGIMAWCINAVQNFEFQPTNLLISLLNDQHLPVQSWYVVNAIPKSVEFSDLNAEKSGIAIETLVLSYSYFRVLNLSAGLSSAIKM